MANQHPDVTDEEIGMRAFKIRRAKAVERTLERMRRGLGDNWSMLSQRDIHDLSWMIGEVWSYVPRAEWEDLHFGKLTAEEVLDLIATGRALEAEPHKTVETLDRIVAMVRARSV